MIQKMSYNDFKFMSKKEINSFCLDSINENSVVGYILEVGLEYCKELHDMHNDYPLCPQKTEINYNTLSKYCRDIADKYEIKVGGVKKLFPNLRDKVKYVVHYKNLQYYLSLGMKLIKVHRILKFKQSNSLKEYIMFNADKRKNALNNFDKDLFKLTNDSVFGKTMGNLRKRINVRLINNSKEYLKCASRPNFVSQKIFSKNVIAVHLMKICANIRQTNMCWI